MAQLRPERKSLVETGPEAVPGGALAEEDSRLVLRPCSGQTCHLAFDQGAIGAADASRFPGAEDLRHARQLEFINPDEAICHVASEQARQFHIRDEMKAAGQVVAILAPGPGAIGQGHAFDARRAFGFHRPATAPIRHAEQAGLHAHALEQLAGIPPQPHAEAHDLAPIRLLGDQANARTRLSQSVRSGQQQRAVAGDHHPFSRDGPTRLDHSIQSPGTHHSRQRPPGKWKKPLAGSGRQYQLLPV